MKLTAWVFALLCIARPTWAEQGLNADQIMRRVAENQDRLLKERTQFVYDEQIHVTSRQTNGKLICEQTTEYTVTPKENTAAYTLVGTHGDCVRKGERVHFDKDPAEDETIDTDLVKDMRNDLTKGESKDGIGKGLFPFTSDEQRDLEFRLAGERVVKNRPAYVITFRPKDRKEFAWAGEAVIDEQDFQPVTVYTKLSRKLPLLVRGMLGTDLPGLGFTTQYTRVADGIWFPESFGSEFKLRVVFFFNRTITMDIQNKNFRRANVDTHINYNTAAAAPVGNAQ